MLSDSSNTDIRILIVEDFQPETEALLLELRGADMAFAPTVVKSEKEYLDALADSDPDVILSPYSLKITNAVKLLKMAREQGSTIPFILLAYDLSEDIAIDLLAEGIEDYVLRSTIKRLPIAIKKALQRHKTQLELKINESQLRNSEASLRNMVRNAPMAVAMFDLNMTYLVVSDKWLKHENKTEDDLIGKNHYEVVPEIPDAWKKVHQKCLKGATLSADREMFERVDGSKQILRWKMNPWNDASGAIGGAVLFIEDVTEQILAKEAFEEQTFQKDLILSTARIGVWHWEVGSPKMYWDERCAQLFDNKETEIKTEDFYNMIHPDDRNAVGEKLIDSLKNGDYSAEYRLIKGTETSFVLSRGRATFGKDGRATRIDGILIDMTERHLLEAAQQESERLFRDLAENISEVFWLTDWRINRVLYVSPRYESLYEQPVSELYDDSKSWFKNIHPEDLAFVKNQFRQFATTGDYDIEYRLLMKDGKIKWVRDRSFPIFDDEGTVSRIAGITVEITQQKSDQEQIETLSLVASETTNGVLIQDANGVITWANRGFMNITGYAMHEVVGKEPWSFLSGDETNRKLIDTTYSKMKAGKPFSSNNCLVNKSGKLIWVTTTFSPILDKNGVLKKIVSIGIDITKHIELEGLQRTLLKELESRVNERTLELEKANEELKKRSSD